MRQRSFIAVAVLVAVLIVGAVAVYAYDSSRDDQIAEGVSIADVDVGGLGTEEARHVVRREVAADLEQPIAVRYAKRRFVLSVKSARLRADVDGMVDEALEESRDGNIIGRVARDLTGGEEGAQVAPRVFYSRQAVGRLVKRVERGVNRPARDATLNFPSLTRVKEQRGVKVKAGVLRGRVEQALTVPGVGREVTTPTRILQPKVTRKELAARYPHLLVINRPGFQLTYYRKLRRVSTHTIAVGQVGLETPAGMYRIENKAINPAWHVPTSSWAGSLAGTVVPGGTPQNPLKARWMGIAAGAGIHGTDQVGSLGSAASHGCVRMSIPEVIELYDKVPVKTPVYVA
jgi:lipoprotein-anchoring transpeptidase ErfK/SrfK